MGRASFWQFIYLCENTQQAVTIFQQSDEGRPPRPIYQQIATALYILGTSGGGAERARILLDIGHGTIWEYTCIWPFVSFWSILQDDIFRALS